MKRILNRKGSALIWVLCLSAVLIIISFAILAIAVSQSQKVSDEGKAFRSELYLRSAIGIISDQIASDTAETAKYIPTMGTSQTVTVTLDSSKTASIVKVEINHRSENAILLTASNLTDITMQARMNKDKDGKWTFTGYIGS